MSDEAARAFGAPPPARPASRAGYWVGGLLIGLGVLAAVLWAIWGFARFGDAIDDLARVPVGDGGVVELSAGRKAIYYERFDAQDRVPAPRIAIRPVGGRPLKIEDHSGSVSYALSGHTGQSVASVRIPRDGRYALTARATDPAVTDAELAIGKGLGNRIVRIIVGAILLVIVGVVAGTVLIVVTQRRRAA